MSQIIIAPTTAAATLTMRIPFNRRDMTIQVDANIDAGKVVAIEQLDTDQQWRPIKLGGQPLVLSANNTQVSFTAANKIRLNKPSTTATVGVQLISDLSFGVNEESDSPSSSVSSSPTTSISSSASSSPSASVSSSPSASASSSPSAS